MNVHVEPISPVHEMWERGPEAYRVYMWEKRGGMWECAVYRVTGLDDVADVIAWANENANGQMVTIYAEVSRPQRSGLVQVHGIDPTRGTPSSERP